MNHEDGWHLAIRDKDESLLIRDINILLSQIGVDDVIDMHEVHPSAYVNDKLREFLNAQLLQFDER